MVFFQCHKRRRRPSFPVPETAAQGMAGSPFIGRTSSCKALDAWASDNQVRLDFIRPGKPVDNAHIEAFNGRVRDECLNQHWFLNLNDARRILADWRHTYNTARPHRALNRLTPQQFAGQFQEPINQRLSA